MTAPWRIYVHPELGEKCPSCKNAKEYLKSRGIPFDSINGKNAPKSSNHHKTWPKIYDPTGKFIGGYSDLQKMVK